MARRQRLDPGPWRHRWKCRALYTVRWPAASALVHGTEVPLKQRHNDMVSIWVQISLTNELGAPERNME